MGLQRSFHQGLLTIPRAKVRGLPPRRPSRRLFLKGIPSNQSASWSRFPSDRATSPQSERFFVFHMAIYANPDVHPSRSLVEAIGRCIASLPSMAGANHRYRREKFGQVCDDEDLVSRSCHGWPDRPLTQRLHGGLYRANGCGDGEHVPCSRSAASGSFAETGPGAGGD